MNHYIESYQYEEENEDTSKIRVKLILDLDDENIDISLANKKYQKITDSIKQFENNSNQDRMLHIARNAIDYVRNPKKHEHLRFASIRSEDFDFWELHGAEFAVIDVPHQNFSQH